MISKSFKILLHPPICKLQKNLTSLFSWPLCHYCVTSTGAYLLTHKPASIMESFPCDLLHTIFISILTCFSCNPVLVPCLLNDLCACDSPERPRNGLTICLLSNPHWCFSRWLLKCLKHMNMEVWIWMEYGIWQDESNYQLYANK